MRTKQILMYVGLALLPCLILIIDGRVDEGLRLMFLPVFFAALLIGDRYYRRLAFRATRAKARRRRADLRHH